MCFGVLWGGFCQKIRIVWKKLYGLVHIGIWSFLRVIKTAPFLMLRISTIPNC